MESAWWLKLAVALAEKSVDAGGDRSSAGSPCGPTGCAVHGRGALKPTAHWIFSANYDLFSRLAVEVDLAETGPPARIAARGTAG